MFADQTTLKDLQFERIIQALAQRCRTEVGAQRALVRPFFADFEEVKEQLNRVEEAVQLIDAGASMPLEGVFDITESVDRAEKGALIDAPTLLSTGRVLRALALTGLWEHPLLRQLPLTAKTLRRIVDSHRLGEVASRIEKAIEPSGELADDASQELYQARQRVRTLTRGVKKQLETFLQDQKAIPYFQERYYSVRNQRYVVPVIASHRNQVPGIVHNSSQSGQTLFIEPSHLIGMGNDLSIAHFRVEQEERRILSELSYLIGESAPSVKPALQAVAELDEAGAAARLSKDLNAQIPLLSAGESKQLSLIGIRHPLLVLQSLKGGPPAVENQVKVVEPVKALVISGPNTGGKTVTLSAVGLCALMLRAGLPIPVLGTSMFPWYASVGSILGDSQDVSTGLSTFSGHLLRLKALGQDVRPASLLLIDEIAAGTDPREGSALAVAFLDHFIQLGATVLVTTHLDEVKSLAEVNPQFLNARMGLDPKTFAPTYRLEIGVPGRSSAIETAQRLGVSNRVVEHAKKIISAGEGPLAQALKRLDQQKQVAVSRDEELKLATENLEKERNLLALERQALADRLSQAEIEHHQVLREEVEHVRAELQRLLKSDNLASAIGRTTQMINGHQTPRMGAQSASRAEVFSVGDWVCYLPLNREGPILELNVDDVLISLGQMKMRVSVSQLIPARRPKKATPKYPPIPTRLSEVPERCDVRGMRAEDALREVDRFLDALSAHGSSQGFILHGLGTGALKQAIRQHLEGSPYLQSFGPAQSTHGGDGITQVILKS